MSLSRILLLVAICVSCASACDPKPLYGVTYAPLALDLDNICIAVEQVKEDMARIVAIASSVRIYNIGVCKDNAIAVMDAAKEANITVVLGLWMQGGNPDIFEHELSLLPEFMEKYSDIIEYVIAGNEPGFIQLIPLETIIANAARVKTVLLELGYPHLVSVAEVWPYLETPGGKQLADAVDFVCMNMQPYWEGFNVKCPEEDPGCVTAARYIHLKREGLEGYFGKKVVICEAGWPTKGEPCCSGTRDNAQSGFKAVPSLENASYFVQDMASISHEKSEKFYIHTSFDEEWKKIWDPCDECKGLQVSKFSEDECGTCEVDYNWGIWTYKRERKAGYVLPDAEPRCHYT